MLSEDTMAGMIFATILSTAVFIALSFLLSLQFYVAVTGQTTIDYYAWSDARKALKARGLPYGDLTRPPFDKGSWAKNWQEAFDERGQLWFIRWCLPRLRPYRGSGVYYQAHGPHALPC
jgi:hypothetical protein